ncbi:MAG: hypothetical protein ACFFKA_06725 [Candidatus Thorarchaeota archaeon]
MGETTPSKPKFSITAPSGAARIVALMAALVVIREGITLFWTLVPLNIFYGIMEIIFAGILIIVLNIVDFGIPFFKNLYKWWIILILGFLIMLFEILALYLVTTIPLFQMIIAGIYLLGGMLTIISAILELMVGKEKMKASQVVALFGVVYTIFEVIVLFTIGGQQNIYHGIIGIIFIVLLLISMQKKIDLKIKYEWWVVLIIGFVLFSWVNPGIGGTIILISFILMLLAY